MLFAEFGCFIISIYARNISDLIDLIYKFNFQAVGYSRSSLPRGTQYNTQTEQMTIYRIYKNNLQTQRTVATTKTYIIT